MKYVIQNIAKSRESSLFTQDTEFEGVCRSRLKRRAARFEAENLCKELSEHHRALFEFFTVKPWDKGLAKVSVFLAWNGVSERDDNVNTIRIATEKRAIEIGADLMSTPMVQHLAA